MSKKRFTEGLESLFGESKPASRKATDLPVVEIQPEETDDGTTRKNFLSELESWFADSLHESIQASDPSDPSDQPAGGLDSLIRSTIETSEMEVNYESRKRVTFTFEKEKLEKLKRIAKLEKTYLREIIGELLSEYIESYESKDENR